MSRFAKRSNDPEIMDDLECSGEVVHQTLKEIDFINRWLGGNPITLSGIEIILVNQKEKIQTLHLADIGCGSGDMLKLVSSFLKRKKITSTLTGIDANPDIVAYAERNCKAFPEISFCTENILQESFRNKQFDIVTATLFLHHFTESQLVEILTSLNKQVRLGIVINDLHRHPLAYYFIKALTALFSKSAMVKYDAPLSVLRGFKKKEWIEILDKAGIKNYSLKWKWAFRWQVVIPG